jgi:hypothetical protein
MKLPKELLRGFWGQIGGTLAALLISSAGFFPKIYPWFKNLTNEQVSSIRILFGYLVLIILGVIGWILFFKTKAKLKKKQFELNTKQTELETALKTPVRLQDDFQFDERNGVYSHKTKPGTFCAGCLHKGMVGDVPAIRADLTIPAQPYSEVEIKPDGDISKWELKYRPDVQAAIKSFPRGADIFGKGYILC